MHLCIYILDESLNFFSADFDAKKALTTPGIYIYNIIYNRILIINVWKNSFLL